MPWIIEFPQPMCGFIKRCASPVRVLATKVNIISYPLFADADTGIFPHAASQYHARPTAKRGNAMLSVDKFPYTWRQTRGNGFIPWSNDLCRILKLFHNLTIPAIPFYGLNHRINTVLLGRIAVARKVDGGCDRHCDVSMTFPSLYILRLWRQTWDTRLYLTVISQSEARVSTEHGMYIYIYVCVCEMHFMNFAKGMINSNSRHQLFSCYLYWICDTSVNFVFRGLDIGLSAAECRAIILIDSKRYKNQDAAFSVLQNLRKSKYQLEGFILCYVMMHKCVSASSYEHMDLNYKDMTVSSLSFLFSL